MDQQQNTLYYNGRIFTMNRDMPRVQALLVHDGRIVALGPRELVESQAGPYTRRIDLQDQTVVPGFNDCHCHILSFGLTLEEVDVGAESVQSIADIQHVLREAANGLGAESWLVGHGYDQNELKENRHPTRADLDDVGQGRPVVVFHTSGHALVANSRALELAGVSSRTQTPRGGAIERDEHGEPTGVLKESPAMDLVSVAIPPPTPEQGAEAVIRAMDVMASQGITSASDASTGEGSGISAELDIYRKALDSGKLSGRITLMPRIQHVAPPHSNAICDRDEFRVGNQPDWLDIGPTKIFVDGALTTRTAALRQSYRDGGGTGLLIWDQGTLGSMIRRAHGAGWQIATHAIGDRAVEMVLDCYEQAMAERHRDGHRHRIEHCMLIDHALATRIQRAKVVPVIQPGFIGRLGDAYVSALGEERASQLMPMELFDWLGITVAFSSDRPVVPGAPLRGVRAAMERTTPHGVPLGPQHKISALEALRHYTWGGAYATHAESRKGALRRGMLADFTVLSRDPTETPAEEFSRVRVTMTVVGGVETFAE